VTEQNLEELYYSTLKPISSGQMVKGTVVQIRAREALVDIGYKSEGVIPIADFDEPENVKVGDEIEVLLEAKENSEGMVALSLEKADIFKNWGRIQKAYHASETISGKVTKKVKGGYSVNIGIAAFLPSSQVSLDSASSEELVGKTLEFKILKTNQWRKNVVLSRKAYLGEIREKQKKELFGTLKEKDVVKGTVKNITDFGAFIDLGGLVGLLHITDISWGRVAHPSEALAMGEEVDVVILEIDKEKERVSLGLKQKTEDPWKGIEKKYPPNSKIKGKVVNITNYGAFIEIEKGIEGLVHISEMSWTKRITHPSQFLGMGDVVETVVTNVDKENKKMALSIKQIEPDPWLQIEEKYPAGSKVKGKIRTLTDYGAFVEIEEGVEGLIHISDLSWSVGMEHPSQVVKKGEEVEVLVLGIDSKEKKISLGRKQLLPDPWEKVEGKYSVGMELKGKVTKVTDFGAFMELSPGIEGLLHTSQISEKKSNNVAEMFSVGEEVKAWIIKIDLENKKIALSTKSSPQEKPSS